MEKEEIKIMLRVREDIKKNLQKLTDFQFGCLMAYFKAKSLTGLARAIMDAPTNIKEELMDTYDWQNVRICSHCGKFMDEGYYLDGEYACSDECAIAVYDGDEKQFRDDVSHAEEDGCETYWTDWYECD